MVSLQPSRHRDVSPRALCIRVLVNTSVCLLLMCITLWAEPKPLVRVGSKSFTESYILGEIIAQIIEQAGEARVERKLGLGGTGITYRAVLNGNIRKSQCIAGPF